MGFSIGGALSGALGGFAAGGPLGAFAGGIGAGLLGGQAQSSARQKQADSVSMAREQMAFQTQAATTAYKRSRHGAGRQMNFQERMAGSAHQRQVADLKKAGLNPILAAGGSGASSPGGAMPAVSSPQGAKGEAQDIKAAGITTALNAMQIKANIGLTEAQTAKVTSDMNPVERWKQMYDSLPDAVKNSAIGKWFLEQITDTVGNAKPVKVPKTSNHKATYNDPAGSNSADINRRRKNSNRHHFLKPNWDK